MTELGKVVGKLLMYYLTRVLNFNSHFGLPVRLEALFPSGINIYGNLELCSSFLDSFSLMFSDPVA